MRIPLELAATLVAAAVGVAVFHWHPWRRRSVCCLPGAAHSALMGNQATLANAIALYRDEHNGNLPALAGFTDQLTLFTDIDGNPSAIKDEDHSLGPYVRVVPAIPLGPSKCLNTVGADSGAGIAWVYDERTGMILGNCDPVDSY